jgi:hypothetical protein
LVHEPAAAEQAGRDPLSSVFSTIFVDKPRQQVGGDYGITSLTADRSGNAYFADVRTGTVERVGLGGNVSQFAGLPKGTSILLYHRPQARLK